MGHTAWAPEGREGRYQAGPKGRSLKSRIIKPLVAKRPGKKSELKNQKKMKEKNEQKWKKMKKKKIKKIRI